MFERITAIFIKEIAQVLRDPRIRMVLFVAPVIQILVFGYAATTDVHDIPTAIYDLDNTPQSRDIIKAFSYSKYFTVKYYVYNDKQQRDLIDNSMANVVIRFNHGYAGALEGKGKALVQLIVDGTDSNTAAVVLSYASRIIEPYAYKLFKDRAKIALNMADEFPGIDLRSRAWFNENLESKYFYIPGVIALLITIMTLILTSMAIVREKEMGTIEQLMVSPLKPFELILGKLAPFAMIALIDVVFVTTLGVLLFQVPVRGSILFLFGSTLVYLLASLGVGLFISTLCSTQQEAMLSVFLFFFPANLLSGFMFPIFNMPKVIQYITYLNPLRYYLVILRGIFLKGVGLDILWPPLLALFVIGVFILTISSLRFHKTLG